MIEVNEPSNYMTELTRYLSNIISSVLLGLPDGIKDLIYSDALSHAASNVIVCLPRHICLIYEHHLLTMV